MAVACRNGEKFVAIWNRKGRAIMGRERLTPCRYSPDEYLMYDNIAAFNVDNVSSIPVDDSFEMVVTLQQFAEMKAKGFDIKVIDGYRIRVQNPVLGVPVTFLNAYDPEQFEILGLSMYSIRGRRVCMRLLIRKRIE